MANKSQVVNTCQALNDIDPKQQTTGLLLSFKNYMFVLVCKSTFRNSNSLYYTKRFRLYGS